MATLRQLAIVGAALAVAGCTQEQSVLALSNVTTCDEAFMAPPGVTCDLMDVCKRPAPNDPMCCSDTVYCTPMGLVVDSTCNPDCSMCFDDTGCAFGAAICVNGACTPCPPPQMCADCPTGWERLRRNGCETCECAPPSQCKFDPMVETCEPPEVCYMGARCTPECAPGDECCANACAAPGCMGPAPIGCFMKCSDPTTCMDCVAEDCECTNGAWVCTDRCVDDTFVSATCIVP